MKKIVAICATSLIAATLSLSALAADGDNVWMKTDRGSIAAGIFFVEESTEIRLSSDTLGEGTLISFEDDLGLDEDEEVVRVGGYYRFKPRHRIEFSYFNISRDGTATLLRDIQIEDEIFTAGDQVTTDLDFTVFKTSYAYSFYQTPKLELGVSTSLTIYDFDSNIVSPLTNTEEDGDGTAPFPTFGLRVKWPFAPKWLLAASYDYFEIDESDVEGQVIDILVGVEYRAWQKVSLGLGYNDVTIDAEDLEDKDELDWEYDGFFGYARYTF
ncbi:MAG: hypothetical protein ACE5NW_15160 [Acidiferrobacterales bacterium]